MEKLKIKIKQRFSFNPDEKRNFILKHCQAEYHDLKKVADLLLNNTFLFNSNWDMEPCPVSYEINPLKWDIVCHDDPEWTFMLNRQEYLLKLIVAYIIEKDVRYVNKCKEFIFDWINQVKEFTPGSLTTRTIDTGIRCLSWLKVCIYLVALNQINNDELLCIIGNIEKQILFLRENYIDKYSLSNWGVLQTSAILSCYDVFKEYFNIDEINNFAFEELKHQIQLQILEDGSQWEQSIMYHVEVFRALMDIYKYCMNTRDFLNPILHKMAYYIQMMTGPDFHQIPTGDSDVSDTRDILTHAALLLDDERLMLDKKIISIESVLMFDSEKLDLFKTMKPNYIEKESILFKDSGQVCAKYYNNYMYFKCGQMSSGHTHSDLNSICLYHKGKPIFVDSGRYTYTEIKERYDLKSSYSHSSVIIDDCPEEIIKDSWDFLRYPQAMHIEMNSRDCFTYCEGSYIAENRYYAKRKCLMLSEIGWIIIDDIRYKGEHHVSTSFVLDSAIRYDNGKIGQLCVYTQKDFESKDTIVSKKYNQLNKSSKIVKSNLFKDRFLDYTMFIDEEFDIETMTIMQSGQTNALPNSIAFRIYNSHYSYIVAFVNDEIHTGMKICQVGNYKLRGKCVVFDCNNNQMIRLKN